MTTPSKDTVEWCKRLRLGSNFVEAVTAKKSKERDYLIELLEGEINRRDALAIERNIKNACFPELKTLADFDFTHVEMPTSVARPFYTDAVFVQSKYSIFMYGRPGTGKTHLAIALGIEACRHFHKVAFYRLPSLIAQLREAKSTNDARFYKRLSKTDLIILDEFGYPPREDDTIELLFDFISNYCYQQKSLIMTSNRTFKEWLTDFPDPRAEKMAQATLDRIAQNTLLFNFTGESRRANFTNSSEIAH